MRTHDSLQIPLRVSSWPLLVVVVLVASAAVGAPSDGARPRNEKAIADIESGRQATARASWWGFDPEDATSSFQAALNSPAKRVIVDRLDRPWIVTTIQLPSDKEIIFEAGVTVEAKRGAFLGKGDCLFEARGCKSLTLRGEGATLRMHKSDYHKPPYALAEWRHALSIRGCEDVTVEGLTLAESGGDGIYLGAGADRSTNRDITIRNVDCDGNNRQGISVITAENLLIESCTFRNTRGTAPEAGIDFEPNHPEERLVSCVVRNCRSEDNAGHAYHIYLGQMNAESAPVTIRFEDCTSKGCERYSTYVGMANREGKRTVRGTIEYARCRFDSDRGAGVYIRGNEADGCRLRFQECEIIRRDEPGSRMAPITIAAPAQPDVDAGNIELANCRIRDALERKPIALSASPLTALRNVSGSLTIDSSSRETRYVLDAEQLRSWFPEQGLLAGIPRRSFDWRDSQPVPSNATAAGDDRSTFRLRRSATLVVWARSGREVRWTTTVEPVGRHTPRSRPIELTAPDGTVSELEPQVDGDRTVYTFTAEVDGPHRLHWTGDPRETLRVLHSSERLAILGEPLGAHFIRPLGTLEFRVPSGVGRFGLVVTGSEPGETVKASIRNAAGTVVAERDLIAAPYAFVLERDDDTVTETWSITFERASEGVLEDVTVQTVGIPPLLSAAAREFDEKPGGRDS